MKLFLMSILPSFWHRTTLQPYVPVLSVLVNERGKGGNLFDNESLFFKPSAIFCQIFFFKISKEVERNNPDVILTSFGWPVHLWVCVCTLSDTISRPFCCAPGQLCMERETFRLLNTMWTTLLLPPGSIKSSDRWRTKINRTTRCRKQGSAALW